VCRWLAYSGSPLPLENLVSTPANSLIHQSRESALGATALNADGFGVGWYAPADPVPALFRSVQPAWADTNLGELARHVRSPLFLAHVRATTGTPVQQTNCHPFRHEGWLWCHNGAVRDFARVKRDLVLAIDPQLFPCIVGSTDSEVLFHLALTFGLREDPVSAVETMIDHVEQVGRAHGVEQPLQMTVATTDGTRLWAFRHSSERASRSLFYSTDVATLRLLHPEVPGLREVSEETRLVVSEPLFDLSGAWVEVPESSYVIVEDGQDEIGALAASRGGRL
jgi:glutamine amidotransferase